VNAHHDRSHSTWSASATERNWQCAGSLTLAGRVTEQRENEAAAWGSCAHQIAERCLHDGGDASRFIDTEEKNGKFTFTVDEEMANTAQEFIDYVRKQQWLNVGSTIHIEQHFTLEKLNPPFDAGGTCDVVMHFPVAKMLEVVDLKGGRGVVVEVTGNPQLRTYALGAMLANPGLDVEKVKATIVQPRAPHKDGRIRSETFHVADLVEWTTDLVAAMQRSAKAQHEYHSARLMKSNAPWEREFLNAGNWCKFCPAAGFCPALEQRALDAAGVWFDDSDMPRLANAPDSMDATEIAKKLDMLDMIQEWMNALRAYAHAQAEHGVEIPGYQLADKIGNRAWKGEEAKIRSDLTKLGLKPFELDNVKIKSPAQIDKLLGAKRKHLIDDLVERPVRGTNLVAVGKTTRPAVQSAAEKYFEAT